MFILYVAMFVTLVLYDLNIISLQQTVSIIYADLLALLAIAIFETIITPFTNKREHPMSY